MSHNLLLASRQPRVVGCSGMQVVIVIFTIIAVVISALAFYVSFLSFLARNRPYVGVSSLSVRGQPDEEKLLDITLKNMGSVPATDVVINVSYPVSIPASGSICVGVIFPGSDAHVTISEPQGFFYFPDKAEDVVLPSGNVVSESTFSHPGRADVYCRITYRQAPIPVFGWYMPSYCTYQPMYVTVAGQWHPSDSEPAEIT
jgi:hypothetical protein